MWGLLAFMLNFVPYIGSLVVTGGSALVGFVQFGSVEMALLVAGASLVIHTISGNLLTPWLTGRASRLNAVTVFVAVLAFGWLWGIWGLVLGVPDPADDQGRVRPGRRPQAVGRDARRVTGMSPRAAAGAPTLKASTPRRARVVP